MWQISLMLANADKLPATAAELLKKPALVEVPNMNQAASR
jgi:hypothetical protein